MEGGNFDHTPAPSGRPSLSFLRTKSDEDGYSTSSITSAMNTTVLRHHLLKTSTSGPTIVDRDIPVPPVLDPSPSISDAFPVSQYLGGELENTPSSRFRQSSTHSIDSCPVTGHDRMAMSQLIPLSDRTIFCKSPTLEGNFSPRSNAPNRSKGAELKRSGSSASDSAGIHFTPRAPLQSSDNGVKIGDKETLDSASNDNFQLVDIRVAVPGHHGHSHASKARPALQHHSTHHSAIPSGGHGLDIRSSRSKVGPFDPTLELFIDLEQKGEHFVSGSSTAVSLNYSSSDPTGEKSTQLFRANPGDFGGTWGHLCHGHISKVQVAQEGFDLGPYDEAGLSPVIDPQVPDDTLAFSTSKVRPYIPSLDHSSKLSQRPAYESKVKPMVEFTFNSPRYLSPRGSIEGTGTLTPVSHRSMGFPVAKAKPCRTDSSNGTSPHQRYHHISKAQAFLHSNPPSAFPSQSALDQCKRCQTPRLPWVNRSEGSSKRSDGGSSYSRTSPSEQIAGLHENPEKHLAYKRSGPHAVENCQYIRQRSQETQIGFGKVPGTYPLVPVLQKDIDESDDTCRNPSLEGANAGSVSSISTQGAKFEVVDVHGVPPFVQGKEPPARFENSAAPQPTQDFIHAPIPISKFWPFLQDRNSCDHESRISGLGGEVAHSGSLPASPPTARFFDIECGTSQHGGNTNQNGGGPKDSSGRSQSFNSILDYKRTAHWLRQFWRQPESYSTRFTDRPGKNKVGNIASPDQRRETESVLSSFLPGRRHKSAPSVRSDSKVDGYGFTHAFSDLERLLNEALAIASQVVEKPETSQPQRSEGQSVSSHRLCLEMPDRDADSCESRMNLTTPNAPDTAKYAEEVGLDEVRGAKRASCPETAKRPELPRRPRLDEVMQGYSGSCNVMNRGSSNLADDQGSNLQSEPRIPFKVPPRKSSKNTASFITAGIEGSKEGADAATERSRKRVHYDEEPAFTKNVVIQLNPERQIHHNHGEMASSKQATMHHGEYGDHQDQSESLPERDIAGRPMHTGHGINPQRRSHVSLRGPSGFSLAKSHKRQSIARDWSCSRKRFVASVACISTALIGIILGIYAGLVPSIQYYIIDQSHVTVYGNMGCFLGLAVPTFFFWPLPLLHGRKPYILSSLVLAMPLLFPQALAVNSQRLTNTASWRSMLLVSRGLIGLSLGFASMNFHSILLDLFGASLMSTNPHQEVVDDHDARRHGGGMGVWLGIWTWCWIGTLAIGFLIGACIIENYPPAWGFYVSIIMIAVVLFLNVVCPEVRRSAFRRSVAEVRTASEISRRVARGEIMMHRVKTGPTWAGQEVYHGVALSLEMLRQPGFAVMTLYSSWIYAQVVLIIALLGSLTSRLYKLRSPEVGLLVGSMALGAVLATPFQKANLFSRSRQAQLNSNLATLNRKVAWSSHLVRRTIFTLLLPLAGICYAAVSSGPPMHVSVPTTFSACVGFLSCLAISECNGFVMEAFDCSDLSPGMTGRQRGVSGKDQKRTNYSSFPRVTAGFAVIHGLAFLLAAGSTALGGLVTRTLGQQVSTGIVAGILLVITLLLFLVLVRFAEVQIVPKCKSDEMDRLVEVRRRSTIRRASMPNVPEAVMDEEMAWRPRMIGNPTGKKRRMNIFELGSLTRWQEIRKKNDLIDSGAHLNRAAWNRGIEALDDQMSELQRDAKEFFHIGDRRSRNRHDTDGGSETEDGSADIELADIQGMKAEGSSGRNRTVQGKCVPGQNVNKEAEDELRHTRRRR